MPSFGLLVVLNAFFWVAFGVKCLLLGCLWCPKLVVLVVSQACGVKYLSFGLLVVLVVSQAGVGSAACGVAPRH